MYLDWIWIGLGWTKSNRLVLLLGDLGKPTTKSNCLYISNRRLRSETSPVTEIDSWHKAVHKDVMIVLVNWVLGGVGAGPHASKKGTRSISIFNKNLHWQLREKLSIFGHYIIMAFYVILKLFPETVSYPWELYERNQFWYFLLPILATMNLEIISARVQLQ